MFTASAASFVSRIIKFACFQPPPFCRSCGSNQVTLSPPQVGVEESLKGFSQSEDLVVSVYIPYCEAGSEWEVVIDMEAPERCPDLVPMPATEAEVGKVRP